MSDWLDSYPNYKEVFAEAIKVWERKEGDAMTDPITVTITITDPDVLFQLNVLAQVYGVEDSIQRILKSWAEAEKEQT